MTNVNLLKSKMAEKGLTQADVAKKMNIFRVSFNYKLNGEREFSGREIYNLCKILNIKDKDPIFLVTM